MKYIIYIGLLIFSIARSQNLSAQTTIMGSLDEPMPQPDEPKRDTLKQVFTMVDVMPEFPGGQAALYKYLQTNLHYPQSAIEAEISGKVYVKFIVDEEGNITNATITRGVSKDLDNEALRVVRSMPKWKPGSQNGKPVEVYFSLPINFSLQ